MSKQLFNIRINSKGKHYECSSFDSILTVGLRHGLAIRYDCSNGTCGTCKAKLLKGDIKQIKHHDFKLLEADLNNAEFLTCCHAPCSDIEIALDLIGDVSAIAIQHIETKVKSIEFVNDDMAIIRLRAPKYLTYYNLWRVKM